MSKNTFEKILKTRGFKNIDNLDHVILSKNILKRSGDIRKYLFSFYDQNYRQWSLRPDLSISAALKFLKENFNYSKFYAYDESSKSLEHVKTKYPYVNCIYNLNTIEKFDLIVVSNVIHHVKSGERNNLFKKIYNLLDDNGSLLIYEHNPYNPITLKVVANCELDIDAELINKKSLIKLCNENNFKLQKSGYIHFFPSKLKFFFNLERYLKWLFLGAQYFCIFRK